ncbi:hypothetical protein ACYOEI_20335 [Singulisphaera rosea]
MLTSKTVRQSLVIALATFHMVVMLAGPCLHAVPGWDHGASAGAFATDHPSGETTSTPHANSDHCLVCQFLAQGQLIAQPTLQSTDERIATLVPLDRPSTISHPSHAPSRLRAPPLV